MHSIIDSGRQSQFTQEENNQLQDGLQALRDLCRALGRIANEFKTLIPTAKDELLAVLWPIADALFAGRGFFDGAFHAESNSQRTREDDLALMFSSARSIARLSQDAHEAMNPIIEVLDNPNLRAAQDLLESAGEFEFDESFAYTHPVHGANVPWAPRIIGPHGSYRVGQNTMEHATQYTVHCLIDMIGFLQHANVPTDGDAFARLAFRAARDLIDKHFRAWAALGTVVHIDDDKVIRQDVAAGSGLRPYDFFREIRQLELLFNGDPDPNFGGRRFDVGATVDVRVMMDRFQDWQREWVNQASLDQIRMQLGRRRGAASNRGPEGWASEFVHDVGDFWRSMDAYGFGSMGFYFSIPTPPTLPPPSECPEYEAYLDIIQDETAVVRVIGKLREKQQTG